MTTDKQKNWQDQVYERLANDDEGRVCKEISDEACQETPGNFLATLTANTCSSLADKLASAKTTLPWILVHIGAPSWMLSFLVPIRESGSMMPQLWIGSWIRQRQIRKWFWVAGGLIQGFCLILMMVAVGLLEGAQAGLAVIALLVLFSLARAACSVAYKDVLGKTIPKTRRGRLTGWISAVAGLASMSVGLWLSTKGQSDDLTLYLGLLALAAVFWFIAVASYARIQEFPGETAGGKDGWKAAVENLAILKQDPPFRRFVLARALAMGSGLAAPFYVSLASRDLGSSAGLLGLLIAVEGFAGLCSSPVWGRWADQSSRGVFALACAIASITTLTVAYMAHVEMSQEVAYWLYPAAFFLLGVCHAGVRLGRKTYLVDMASGNQRTTYVAVSNTVIGFLLLITGGVIAWLASLSTVLALVGLGVAGLVGSLMGMRLRNVSA